MEPALIVAALLPCYALPSLEAFAPKLPTDMLVHARRLRLNLALDLLYHQRAYDSAVKRQSAPEITMRAYHIRTVKAQIQALHDFLNPIFHQSPTQ